MDGCNENVIEFMTNDTRATLSFSQGRYKSVIRKLAEKHPEDCQIIADNEDGSSCSGILASDFSAKAVYRGAAAADGGKTETEQI